MSRPLVSTLRTLIRCLGVAAAALVLFIMTCWAVMMLHYSNLPSALLRNLAAAAFACLALGLIVWTVNGRRRAAPKWWRPLAVFLLCWSALVVWYRLIPPSDSRAWQPDVARTARAEINGDTVTIRNIRNFHYRSAADFDERWETRTYDLSRLDGHDLMFVYWGTPAIAHTMISFRFRDETRPGGFEFLPISIEVRKERGESYSTVAGFFRQYELYYVVADERDLVGLRTNHRAEDVYIYRTVSSPERSRLILLDYLSRLNQLADHPAWYNALTDNCTNGIVYHVQAIGDDVPITWELVFSGYADRYVYKAGGFVSPAPFDDLKAQSRVNDAARGRDADENFPAIIRRALPGYSATP